MTQKSCEVAGQRSVINVAWVADKGAGTDTGNAAEEFMRHLLPPDAFLMTDIQPDIILFMSGGSERRAISLLETGRPVLLLSINGKNAYAAATEVMAWMVINNIPAILADAMDANVTGLIDRWIQTVGAWHNLRGRKAGLIGSVSDWLVASDVPAERLQSLFDVTLQEIPWSTLDDFSEQEPDAALLDRFIGRDVPGLADACRVLGLLRHTVVKNELSAIAVECFSLVRDRKVTACLALAQLNTEGIAAACEGDLASLAGMMLLEAITCSVPWMANTTSITNNKLLLSHCTAAFNIVDRIELVTHYETDCSLAVSGAVTASEVTVFRLSGMLDKAFISEGKVIGHPHLANACRTQVEIELPSQSIALLRNQPLGNHLLMAPGNLSEQLRLACFYKGIAVVK